MQKTDIDYPRKAKLLEPLLKEVSAQFPPQLWARQLALLYKYFPALAAAGGPPGNAQHQPLRPNSGGGGVPKPGSMGTAIDQGLGYGVGV